MASNHVQSPEPSDCAAGNGSVKRGGQLNSSGTDARSQANLGAEIVCQVCNSTVEHTCRTDIDYDEQGPICPSCGVPFDEETLECGNCYEDQPIDHLDDHFCPRCGEKLPCSGFNICQKCGKVENVELTKDDDGVLECCDCNDKRMGWKV